ncbi:MAG: M48 family metallopeptidase [Verrucomicrobia bacterium]|nr:MAG: M48 family metallopeptidase [Verrucomicrobiota bacterium]
MISGHWTARNASTNITGSRQRTNSSCQVGIDCQTKPTLFTRRVQFEFFRHLTKRFTQDDSLESLEVGGRRLPLVLIRHPRARRYLLRLTPDGAARVTIPRGGSAAEARRFAERSKSWLEQALQRQAARPICSRLWPLGTSILLCGETAVIEIATGVTGNAVRFGVEVVNVAADVTDFRPAIEKHLRQLASEELPPRVQAYAAEHQVTVNRISVRNQKSRWGSCSRRRTISLNWRLIHTPLPVQDYVILHELMHLRQMNHSARFWQEVKSVCPDYEAAERWLKQNASLLR